MMASEHELLARINGWCGENGVLPFDRDQLGRPDGKGPKIVDFYPEQSFANRGFAGSMSFKYQNGTASYIRSLRVNSWKHDIPPVLIDGVLTVVLLRVGGSVFTVLAENYRAAVGGYQLEPARGFATDFDWRGEETEYPAVVLPTEICNPIFPEDGILCLRAARKEAQQEIHGGTPFSTIWYTGYINETDSTARMRTSVWLATAVVSGLDEIKALEPDSQQGRSHIFGLEEVREMIGRKIRSAQVLAALFYALNVIDRTQHLYGSIDPLWNPAIARTSI